MKKIDVPVDDLRERFILWLASKPADMDYPYRDARRCACATFLKEAAKRERIWSWLPWGTVVDRKELRVWPQFDTVASYKPHTYGALLERVRSDQWPR